jgi:hypothetical protein
MFMCTNEKKHDCMSGRFAAAVWVGEVQWVASTPDRILHIRSPQKPSLLESDPHQTSPTQTAAANQPDIQSCFFSFVHINIMTWRWPSTAETCSRYRRNKYNNKTVVFFDGSYFLLLIYVNTTGLMNLKTYLFYNTTLSNIMYDSIHTLTWWHL